jgi:beta-lactamase regulating signal transducer with metallopeptidase domain
MQADFIAEVLSLLQYTGHGMSAAFAAFAHMAAPVAIAALWQGAAVALGLALCLRLTPRLAAGHRFGIWAGGFAVVVALHALPLFLRSSAADGMASGLVSTSGPAARPWLELDVRWTLAIAGLWLGLSVLRAADLAVHTLRLRGLWKSARPIRGLFAAWDNDHSRGPVPVCTTTELDRPSVIGFLAPRILIPDWLYARLTQGELEQVILHECQHLRRRDDWTNLLQKLALVLFPLNPALAWMEYRLCREREMACDEGVVRVTRAPRAYAACLAGMAEQSLERSLARRAAAALSLGAFERRSELAGRVHSILGRKNFLGPLGARAVLGVVGCGLAAGAVELARSPQVVGFVSAPTLAAQATPQLQAVDPDASERLVAVDGESASAFHAINALAVLPAPAANRETNPTKVASAEPREQLIKTEAKGADRNSIKAQRETAPQQWIVLTAWQQTETPAAASSSIADYDASADGDAEDAAAISQTTKSAPRQIAVTQLILRVYPADAKLAPDQTSHSAEQINSARPHIDSHSILSRQAVLPWGNGWLVIQL